jgi:hypothetical protein
MFKIEHTRLTDARCDSKKGHRSAQDCSRARNMNSAAFAEVKVDEQRDAGSVVFPAQCGQHRPGAWSIETNRKHRFCL